MADMTRAERRINQLLGDAADEFSRLPAEHSSDMEEFVRAIHAAQNIVLARVGLRAQREEPVKGPTGFVPNE